MNTYRAFIQDNKSGENLEVLEMRRPRLMARDFRNIVASLFGLAAWNRDYSDLTAEVMCNGRKCFELQMETKPDYFDPSAIRSYLSSSGYLLRTMTVAE